MKSKFELFIDQCYGLLLLSGVDVENISGCPYQLILESGLDRIVDRVAFHVVEGTGSDRFITEVRLNRQDIFIANEWGLFLLDTDGASDVKFEEHTFPDPRYFSESDTQEARIFYHADLSLIVNNVVVLPRVRTDKFRKNRQVVERRELVESGLQEVGDTPLLLEGSRNIYFNLDLPRKTDWKGSCVRLRLRLGGLLFRNACLIT